MESSEAVDASKIAALGVLEKALRSKRPSSWKVYELKMYLELLGEKDAAKGRKAELSQR